MKLETDLFARLDRLPFSRIHTFIALGLGFAWMMASIQASIIGAILGILKKQWTFTDVQGSLTVSTWLAGIMVGASVFGYFNDHYGRKKLLITTLAVFSVFTVLSAFSTGIWMFIVLRFLTACGIGGIYVAVSTAMAELSPSKIRGRLNALIMIAWPIGAFISAALVVGAIKALPPEIAWRVGFLIAAVLGLAILYIRVKLPESPRWLLATGKEDEAEKVVEGIEEQVKRQKGLIEFPHAAKSVHYEVGKQSVWKTTKKLVTHYPFRILMGGSLGFAQVALGYGSIAFASIVLFPVTNTPPADVPMYFLIAFAFAILGGLTSLVMVDSVGRKATLAISYSLFPVSALSMLFVTSPATALISLCFMQYVYTWGWITEYVVKAEFFPTGVRAAAIGWCTTIARLGGVVAPPILTGIYTAKKAQLDVALREVSIALALITLVGTIAALAWVFKGVEGKGRTVEDLVMKKAEVGS